jgi:UDP-glucose 6-dehydrogenase
MWLKAECIEEVNGNRIVFKENKSKLTLLNERKLICRKIKVDGCQIVEGLKCDYALFNNEIECYIELKGQDIKHAFKQLIATMEKLSVQPQMAPKISFVICTRSPMATAEIQNMQFKFKRDYNSKLLVRSGDYEHSI